MTFAELSKRLAEQKGVPLNGDPFLAYDPGMTTGWAHFDGGELTDCGQLETQELQKSLVALQAHLGKYPHTRVVVEDYRVYKWKTDDHAWSSLYTTQLIGMIETLCLMAAVDLIKQPAFVAKSFATDQLLKEWGYWIKGQRHARDAIRHGCYHIVFGGASCQERRDSRKPHNVG